jgi:hypothetical protein
VKHQIKPRVTRIVADFFHLAYPRASAKSAVGILVVLLGVLSAQGFSLDRTAFTFVRYDIEVRVDPAGQALAARGKIHLRNDSTAPQNEFALQISSSLDWRLVNVNGKDVAYSQNDYTTDIDHTGAVSEVVIHLAEPVLPLHEIQVEVGYSGQVTRDAARLARMGVPDDAAARSDWDRIEEPVTAVRGIGYVVWYPVSLPAVLLSGGKSDYFKALSEWKDRERASSMRVNLCWVSEEENLAIVANGTLEGGARQTLGGTEEANTHSGCSAYSYTNVGATVPSFAIANYASLLRPAINVYHLADQASLAKDYAAAAEKLQPLAAQWFGDPKKKVTVIQLPEPGSVPFETGAVLFTPLDALDRKALEARMLHQLVHASLVSPRPWIEEGLARFATTLLTQQEGRAAAIAYMDRFLSPLVAEEQARGESRSGIAVSTDDEILYGVKGMFVWWMLRDMVGDVALQKAIRQYHPAEDKSPSYLPDLISREAHRDLSWFFDDWVYRDRGLPDFRIVSAFPRQTLSNVYVVAVTVDNLGAVGAEVPVIVRTPQGERVKRVMVKAHDKTVERIEVPVAPTDVIVNDGSVPESDTSNNTFKVAPAPPLPR